VPYDRDAAGRETYTFAGSAALAREIDEGLDSAAAHLGSDLPSPPYTFVGFSLGAFLGVSVVADRPGRFDRVVLIEGGHDSWTEARARAFVAGGGSRVLFACGLPSCAVDAMRPLALLLAAGGTVRLLHEEGAGHVFDGAVGSSVGKAVPWLLEGQP
jgi:pimeloyl-ACP methyl ester carboxylesterase